MDCPKCGDGQLKPAYLELFLCVQSCDRCAGHWILIEDYLSWKEQHPEHQYVDVDVECEPEDTAHALLCPQSGLLMRKLRISQQTTHRLDYSAAVGGVWLDNGEWQLLKQAGLAGALNTILTQHWQTQIRQQCSEQTFDLLYRSKFGEQDYDKIKQIREWLQSHPLKADLRSFLIAQDPYSAKR